MLNQVTLLGRLTKDPECGVTANGKTITSFMLAVQRNFRNKDGGYDADFIPCVSFDKTAETIGNNFSKGQRMLCVGEIRVEAVDKDGSKKYFTKVLVQRVDFIEKKDTAGGFSDMGTPQPDNSGFGGFGG